MANYIDRQAAIDAFNTNIDELVVSEKENAEAVERYLNRVIDEIRQLPPIQSEIIRCRECKFASGDSRICMKFDHSPIGELDFCSFAERREVNNMTKREFLDTVFALAPNEANAIMDAFDEYVESNEPHWIPCSERLPETTDAVLTTYIVNGDRSWRYVEESSYYGNDESWDSLWDEYRISGTRIEVIAWMPLPEPYKGVTE